MTNATYSFRVYWHLLAFSPNISGFHSPEFQAGSCFLYLCVNGIAWLTLADGLSEDVIYIISWLPNCYSKWGRGREGYGVFAMSFFSRTVIGGMVVTTDYLDVWVTRMSLVEMVNTRNKFVLIYVSKSWCCLLQHNILVYTDWKMIWKHMGLVEERELQCQVSVPYSILSSSPCLKGEALWALS